MPKGIVVPCGDFLASLPPLSLAGNERRIGANPQSGHLFQNGRLCTEPGARAASCTDDWGFRPTWSDLFPMAVWPLQEGLAPTHEAAPSVFGEELLALPDFQPGLPPPCDCTGCVLLHQAFQRYRKYHEAAQKSAETGSASIATRVQPATPPPDIPARISVREMGALGQLTSLQSLSLTADFASNPGLYSLSSLVRLTSLELLHATSPYLHRPECYTVSEAERFGSGPVYTARVSYSVHSPCSTRNALIGQLTCNVAHEHGRTTMNTPALRSLLRPVAPQTEPYSCGSQVTWDPNDTSLACMARLQRLRISAQLLSPPAVGVLAGLPALTHLHLDQLDLGSYGGHLLQADGSEPWVGAPALAEELKKFQVRNAGCSRS